MEILGGGGRLANIHVAFGGKLHETLDARAGMLRALAFVAVRKQEREACGKAPLVFARTDELIDDDLRAIHEISELGLPEDKAFGIVARESIFKAEASGFGKRRVVDLTEGLRGREMSKRQIFLLGLRIHQDGVALVKSTALRILPREANGIPFEKERAVGKK